MQDHDNLHDNDLRMDVERGDWSGSTSASSTFKRHSVTFDLEDNNPSEVNDNLPISDRTNVYQSRPESREYRYNTFTEHERRFSDGEVSGQWEKRLSFDMHGGAKSHVFGLPKSSFETESTPFNIPNVNDNFEERVLNKERKYRTNTKGKKKRKQFKRRNSGYPIPNVQKNIENECDIDTLYMHGHFSDSQFYDLDKDGGVRFDGYIPFHIPRPCVTQEQNNLNRSIYQTRPTAPQYEPVHGDMNLNEYIGDKDHPGKLVFSSDYIFANEIANPVFNTQERSIPTHGSQQTPQYPTYYSNPNEIYNTEDAVYYTNNYSPSNNQIQRSTKVPSASDIDDGHFPDNTDDTVYYSTANNQHQRSSRVPSTPDIDDNFPDNHVR